MRIWSARSIIAIRAIFILVVLLPVNVLAGGRIEYLVNAASIYSQTPLPATAFLVKACTNNVLCAARHIARHIGPKARLERTIHPDTDTIRRVKSKPSISQWKITPPDTLILSLNHFGRKAVSEITSAYANTSAGMQLQNIVIDLRDNQGGALKRMLHVAALFTGAIPDAIRLTDKNQHKIIAIPKTSQKLKFHSLKLIIGPKTASSAEIFAALMRVHAKAKIIGKRSFGKNYLLRIIPVTHDWQLLVPAETISVPGTSLVGGIIPDEITCCAQSKPD